MDETRSRSAEEVLDDHLRESQSGSIDDDLSRNYSSEVVILCRYGIFHGHAGMRRLNRRLMDELPGATFEYSVKRVAGELGFLEWIAHAEPRWAVGADSYLIRGGKIAAQTIHYTVEPYGSGVTQPSA